MQAGVSLLSFFLALPKEPYLVVLAAPQIVLTGGVGNAVKSVFPKDKRDRKVVVLTANAEYTAR